MTRKINEIRRTATFCWSPGQELVLATGTLSGALDDTFSSASELELFKLSTQQSFKVSSQSRFKKIVWGHASKSDGIIAAAKENGELELWNPTNIFNNKSQDSLISTHSSHSGTIHSLDFNRLQTNLLASAGSQIYIWDLENTSAPYLPGARSSKVGEMMDVAWNCQVQHILATSANNGYTVVWDLRNKKEILTLSTKNHGISSIAWHPSVATQIVTASDDEGVISLWDLRHAHSPENTLANGNSGILDLSWCRQDMDLLLSSGKDGKTLCWNPNKGCLLGEINTSTKWAHQVEWCPRNPDMLATASVGGVISIHSIQGSSEVEKKTPDTQFHATAPLASNLELKTPPKWLRRPIGASFGFSGKLVTFRGSSSVNITTLEINPEMMKRSDQLEAANEQNKIDELIHQRIQQDKNTKDWKILHTLFAENAREQLEHYLGFKKEQIMTEAARLIGISSSSPLSSSSSSATKREEGEVVSTGLFGSSDQPRDDLFGIPSKLQIYGGSDTDKLIARAIVLGDFESGVDICLASERYTDAILLGVCGGSELFARAQNAYFASQAKTAYLQLLQGIMQGDLMKIVQSVALDEWASALVVLCTFAQPKDFSLLCETLGDRLSDTDAALCCYLAAGNLVKVFNIWIDELEKSKSSLNDTTYNLHLQEFIEKITLFKKATEYDEGTDDDDMLAPLHRKYGEYAEWMASQGKLKTALKYLNLTPLNGENNKISIIRDRVFHAYPKWPTRYKVPHFPFKRETLISITSPPQQVYLQQPEYSRIESAIDPINYYIPEYHTYNNKYQQQQQQQPTYSPTATYNNNNNYIPQTAYDTTAYSIQTNNNMYVPSQQQQLLQQQQPSHPYPPLKVEGRGGGGGAWNDPPIMTDLNRPLPNPAPAKRVTKPFANNNIPTTPPLQQQQTDSLYNPNDQTRGPPSSSYYSARQQPTQPMVTPPPPMNAVAPTPMSRRP